jgi:hypothetical protein|nr:MAG TPA: hypothetical protein [Caudoviricetes sp.]
MTYPFRIRTITDSVRKTDRIRTSDRSNQTKTIEHPQASQLQAKLQPQAKPKIKHPTHDEIVDHLIDVAHIDTIHWEKAYTTLQSIVENTDLEYLLNEFQKLKSFYLYEEYKYVNRDKIKLAKTHRDNKTIATFVDTRGDYTEIGFFNILSTEFPLMKLYPNHLSRVIFQKGHFRVTFIYTYDGEHGVMDTKHRFYLWTKERADYVRLGEETSVPYYEETLEV